MPIKSYSEKYRDDFIKMFVTYSVDDLKMQEEDPRLTAEFIEEKIAPFFIRQMERGNLTIDLLMEDGVPVGFSVWQIDRPESDWCKRPGWGFIREFYIERARRRSGFGRMLAEHTVRRLRAAGAEDLYLTTANAGFWKACGFRETGERCNGLMVFEKGREEP